LIGFIKLYVFSWQTLLIISKTKLIFLLALVFCVNLIHGQDLSARVDGARFIKGNDVLERSVEDYCEASIKKARKLYATRLGRAKFESLKDTYTDRKDYFLEMLNDGDLIMDGKLHDYVAGLVDKLSINGQIGEKRSLFIVKDDSPNAFNMGDNNIFVHLGLIYKLNKEEELAFVIGHELGHNELDHYNKKALDFANLAVNDSIKRRIKEIKNSEYRQVSALNELMIPWILAAKSKSRNAENEADAYGFNLIKSSNFDWRNAIGVFDILEQEDEDVDTTFMDLTAIFHLDETGLDFTKALQPKLTSSLGVFEEVEEEGDTLIDLLRTHPFGEERKIAALEKISQDKSGDPPASNPRYQIYKKMALEEIIMDAVYKYQLDKAIFNSIELYKLDNSSALVNTIIPFSFAYLGYAKKKRRAGKSIETQSAYYGKSFNQLIHFLREISPDQCFAISKNWNDRYNDITDLELSSPSLAIFDALAKDEDNFEIRYKNEIERQKNYYITRLLTEIKNENE
jgi:Zn-dependent protease with chaperone function